MKTVMVTGALGFLGRDFIRRVLLDTDWRVVAVYRPGEGRYGVAQAMADASGGRVLAVPHDLREPLEWPGRVDEIVHMAASARVADCLERPCETTANTMLAGLNMLQYAVSARVERVVVLSSMDAVGLQSNPYLAAKAAVDAMAEQWAARAGMPVMVLRVPQVFGAEQPTDKFLPTVVRRLLRRDVIDLYGCWLDSQFEEAWRWWMGVDRSSRTLIHLLGQPAEALDHGYSCRRSLGGEFCSVSALAERAAKILGVRARFRMVARADGGPPCLPDSRVVAPPPEAMSFEEEFEKTVRALAVDDPSAQAARKEREP